MKIISAIMLIIFISSIFAFMTLTIDIMAGRRMGLKTSPYLSVDTTNAALGISVVFMLMSLFASFIILYMYKINKQVSNSL